MASGLASAFLSPAGAAALASPLARPPLASALVALGAVFLLFLGHFHVAGSRNSRRGGRSHFFFGARSGHGDDRTGLFAEDLNASRGHHFADVN